MLDAEVSFVVCETNVWVEIVADLFGYGLNGAADGILNGFLDGIL